MDYAEEDLLPLSGLQHFAFCRRQWALIHIENLWADNLRTIEGDLMHTHAHETAWTEKRGDLLLTHGVRLVSHRLGVSGACDVLEFHRAPDGIPLTGQEGLWLPYPVEYKRGTPKEHNADALQLCAQALCLEEMLCCPIPEGALFYGETRRRLCVPLDETLRAAVRQSLAAMHDLYRRGYTPKSKPSKGCRACSLRDVCLPRLMKSTPVDAYLRAHLEDLP